MRAQERGVYVQKCDLDLQWLTKPEKRFITIDKLIFGCWPWLVITTSSLSWKATHRFFCTRSTVLASVKEELFASAAILATLLTRDLMSTRAVIRRTSRRLQMYRFVKLVIRNLFNAFKAYHKFPSTIASDAQTKTVSGRDAMSVNKRSTINRNADESVNNHGVSNFLRPVSLSGLCSTF